MFDPEDRRTRGDVIRQGFRSGSAIAVVMLAMVALVEALSNQWNEGLTYLVSFMVAGVVGGILQQLWFSPRIILKISYTPRLVGFGLTYFVILFACARLGHWIPVDASGGTWAGFIVIYMGAFAFITLSYHWRFRREAGTYDRLLADYRAHRSGSNTE